MPLIELKNVTLIGFGIGCVIALAMACVMTRDTVGQSMKETRRLVDALSWAAVLPQMLGMLGLVFSDAGVGKAVAHVTTAYISHGLSASWRWPCTASAWRCSRWSWATASRRSR